MQFSDFERVARAAWEEIPERYKEGVDGLIVERAARPHVDDPDVYTLGECVTEEYPSQYGGPETTRSAVVLYYGSFRAVAEDEPGFDWQAEIHETISHELQHHLESLATEDALEDLDYAVDENFKRIRGEVFDPLFYRAGEKYDAVNAVHAGDGARLSELASAFVVEGDVFIEIVTRAKAALAVEWTLAGSRYRAALPAAAADVTYHYVDEGLDIEVGDFCIVRIVRRGALATLRAALRGGDTVVEVVVTAEQIP